MTFRKWAVRFVLFAGGVVLSLVLVAFLAVQIQQRMLRWRGERLLADMHQIRLYQTTWADAQQLMHRWGAWGHYEASCTAASCKYEIRIDNCPRHAWSRWLLIHDRFNLYERLGGHGSAVGVSFTVHDGTIWRGGSWVAVDVPTRRRLHRTLENPFLYMGGAQGLAGHPYYKVGRPSGCEILCQIIIAYYSTHTPPVEIECLTSYNFSCFTRFNPCMHIEDLLPAAREWHLYDSEYESGPTVPVPKERPLSESYMPKPIPCSDIPVWAMARDARYVMAVEALSEKIVEQGDYHRELAQVRVVSSLKERAPWLPGAIVNTDHLYWSKAATPSSENQHMVPGRRYVVFAIGNDDRIQMVTKDSPLSFERCGVHEDTPEVRYELEKGFAQNDMLRP